MPSYFTQIFSNVMAPPAVKRNLDFSYRHMPMLNEVSTSLSSYLASQGQISKKKALMRWYKNTPELVAFINKVVNDCCSFYHFEPANVRSSGKNKVGRANRFALENMFRQTRAQIFSDILVTGDGFGWLAKVPLEVITYKVKEAFSSYANLELKGDVPVMNMEIKQKMMKEILVEMKQSIDPSPDEVEDDSKFPDEDVLMPRKFRYMPSTTVEVVYDRYDIKGYNHFLGVYLPMFFSPQEVIHFTLMRRDGKVNGFTPVEAVIVQLELLRQMWQNQLALHKNGCTIDKIFCLKNLQVSSPAYKRIEEQIAKYRLAENKHGNMLFTGDLQVVDLQQLDEMQFKDLGLYVTGLVAMQWGIPRSSIPFIVGGTNTKDDTGGNSERGYWQFIRGLQMIEAEIWNTQIFIPYFKVRLVPELAYPQLEVQEEAALMSKIQNLQNMDALLLKDKMMVAHDKKMKILGLTEEDIEEAPDEEVNKQMGLNPDGSNPNELNMGSPKTSKDNPHTEQHAGKASAKRQEQQNTTASRGEPTGFGKEMSEIKESIAELKGFIAGTIQKAVIPTRYENRPKVRQDEPVVQFADNKRSHVGKQDSAYATHDGAGPEMPANWAVSKDNRVADENEENMWSQPKVFARTNQKPDLITSPNIQGQLNTCPTGSITTENLFNPAGNLNVGDTAGYGGDNDYADMNNHDTPQTKPKKRTGKYPAQRKYPDEPTQFPGKDEKETEVQKGMKVEEEHRDVYNFMRSILNSTGRLPPWDTVKKKMVDEHLDEVSDYYSKLQKLVQDAKIMEDNDLLEMKSMQGADDQLVDLNTFCKFYMQDRRYNEGMPPRVFMRSSYGIITLKFKSSDFVYKTQISERELRDVKSSILMMNLNGNIYRL